MQTKLFEPKKYVSGKNDKKRYDNSDIIAFVLIQFTLKNNIVKDYFPETGIVGFEFNSTIDYNTFISEIEESDDLSIKMLDKASKTVWIKTKNNKFIKQ